MPRPRVTLLAVFGLLGLAAAVASLAPAERVLGVNVRIVYLHGAWVWTALLLFAAAGGLGLAGLFPRRTRAGLLSVGLGRAGALFWVTSLGLSLWAMQTNWNGLYLAEPRWRLAVEFSIIAILLQAAATLIQRVRVASGLNAAFALTLGISLIRTGSVMHPRAPIASSDSISIQVFFAGLLLVVLIASWLLARLLRPSGWKP
jgi:hypothetical protein